MKTKQKAKKQSRKTVYVVQWKLEPETDWHFFANFARRSEAFNALTAIRKTWPKGYQTRAIKRTIIEEVI